MIDCAPVLYPGTMFQGKYLIVADYFRLYQRMFSGLVADWGREKVDQYYDWLFIQLSRMKWGQWFSVSKFAPQQRMLTLFYWAIETIYQSDPWSQFEFRTVNDDLRVYVVEPSTRQKQNNDFAYGRGKYNLFDLYGYLRVANDDYRPDIRRRWLLLADTDEPDDSEADDAAPDSLFDAEVASPPDD